MLYLSLYLMFFKKLWKRMDTTVLVLAAMVLVAALLALFIGGWSQVTGGVVQAGRLFDSVWLRLLLGFTLGGLVQVLIPHAMVARWLGHRSGMKGMIVGSYIGIILPGGPYVFLPIIASVYKAGAGPGPIIALMAGRAMLGLNALIVWQIPFLGMQLPLARYIVCLVAPPFIGLVGTVVFRIFERISPMPPAAEEEDESVSSQGGVS